jgi:AGZA family xanthine/uracil permease-like MFS transporter
LGWPTVVFIVGLALTGTLVAQRRRGAILTGIVGTTVFAMVLNAIVHVPAQFSAAGVNPRGWGLNVPEWGGKLFSMPDLSLLGKFTLNGSFIQVGIISTVLFVFTLMLADFFDTMGTVVGVGGEAGLTDKRGNLPGMKKVLLIDSVAAAAGGAASVSSNTTYIESAAGVGEGARTGLASVVTGLLFLLALFAAPLVSIVPYEAASPALVVVGFLLMMQVRHIDWENMEVAIPAFLAIILMPFTYSITNGIGAGIVSYAALRIANGKAKQTHWLLFLIALLFIAYFAIDWVEKLVGVQ